MGETNSIDYYAEEVKKDLAEFLKCIKKELLEKEE